MTADADAPAHHATVPPDAAPGGCRSAGKNGIILRWTRRDTLLALGIFALALAIRVVWVLELRASPDFEHPLLDAAYHDEWARDIAAGKPFIDGPYFRAPLYPWLLGACYALFGHSFLIPRLIQACLGAGTCVCLYLLGRDTFGRLAGALAGFAAATYWTFCYFEGELLLEPLTVFLNTLLLWLLLRWRDRLSAGPWLIAGLVGGLSAIARPNILLFFPLVALWLLLMHRERFLRRAVAFTTGCLVPILPVTVRNYVVGHDLVLISSQGGVNFYIGNNPESDGVTAVVPGTPSDWWGGYYAAIRQAEHAEGRPLKASEVSRHYFRAGRSFWQERPAQAVALTLHKLRLFWMPHELGNNKDAHFFARMFVPISHYLPLSFGIVASLGLAGLLWHVRDWRRLLPLWGFLLIYMAGVVAFFVNSRFRIPTLPVLFLFAGALLAALVAKLRQREDGDVLRGVVLAGIAGFLFWRLHVSLPAPSDAHSYQTLAVTYLEDGQPQKAVEWARRFVTVEPERSFAYVILSKALAAGGDLDEALRVVQDAPAPVQDDPQVIKQLTELLAETGRHAAAIDLLRRRIAADPGNLGLQVRLAWFLATAPPAELRNGREALRLSQQAYDATRGEIVDILDVLAAAHAELGNYDLAVRYGEAAAARAARVHQAELGRKIERRVELYRGGEAYRE